MAESAAPIVTEKKTTGTAGKKILKGFTPEEPHFVPIEKKEEKKSVAADFSVWGTAAQRAKQEQQDHRALGDRSSSGGFAGFIHDYFPTFFGTRSAATPSTSPPGEKKAPPAAERGIAPIDLDALLTPPEASPAVGRATPALPKEDLLNAGNESPVAAKKAMLPPVRSTPFVVSPMKDAAVQAAKAPVEKPMKKEEKKKEEKVGVQKETPAADAAPTEIVYKHIAVRKVSSFKEFLGSLRYFGMGKERQAIIQNLAMMLNAGLQLIDSIKTLQMETRAKPMRNLLQRIVDAVENGSPLWRAMEDQHFFPPQAIALIRIGEEAGDLAENMEYLAIQQEKDAALRSKVTMAMIYPVIVLTLMFIIVVGLGMFVLPNLIQVLFSLNVPLPLATRLVIGFTQLFTTYGAVAVPSMIAGFVTLSILGKFTRLKVVAQWLLFHIPGIGRLMREATIARFGVILGGLLQAGVPLVDSLHSLADVTPIVSYSRFYSRLLDHITVGDSFSKSFASISGSRKLLPISVQQLVVTGEKSGSLAKILLKISDIYEKKANDTAQKLPVILEPMLLLFIGSLVGTIAFSIIVPIYSIVGNIGH